jgi:enoyl-CoA hydratase/carnithine racemase
MADLEYSVEQRVGTILLNRPDVKNAFTMPMVDRWAEILREARTDDDVGVIVVTGTGSSFCAGGDLGNISSVAGNTAEGGPLTTRNQLIEHIHRVAIALEDLDKPVIAAVNGSAVGAGLDMALMCDMRFAARSASFVTGYSRLGLVPGDGGAYFLPRVVGLPKALELLLGSERVGAEEALRIGMVNRLIDDEDLLAETYQFAHKLATGAPLATKIMKRLVYNSAKTDMRGALELVSGQLALLMTLDDTKEAVSAFRERRKPTFTGH